MRILLVSTSILGNRSYTDALRLALRDLGAQLTTVELMPSDWQRYPPSRWTRVSEPLAAQAVLRAKLAHTWLDGHWDVLIVNGWDLLDSSSPGT